MSHTWEKIPGPLPLFHIASNRKLGAGLGTRLRNRLFTFSSLNYISYCACMQTLTTAYIISALFYSSTLVQYPRVLPSCPIHSSYTAHIHTDVPHVDTQTSYLSPLTSCVWRHTRSTIAFGSHLWHTATSSRALCCLRYTTQVMKYSIPLNNVIYTVCKYMYMNTQIIHVAHTHRGCSYFQKLPD